MKSDAFDIKMISEFGRADAAFMLLARQYLPLIDELLLKFTREELIEIGKTLRYDMRVASVIFRGGMGVPTEKKFFEWLERNKRTTDHAVYVAAVAQNAASKIRTEVEELKKQEQKKIQELSALLQTSLDKHATHLYDAMKGAVDGVSTSTAGEERPPAEGTGGVVLPAE